MNVRLKKGWGCLNVKAMLTASSLLLCSPFAFSTTEIFLPKTQTQHALDINAEDSVVIYVSENAILEGTIKTDYAIDIVAADMDDEIRPAPNVTLSPTLSILGRDNDTPRSVNFEGVGNIYLNTPLVTRDSIRFDNQPDAIIEINRNINTFNMSGPYWPMEGGIKRNTGVHIKGGVTLDLNSWGAKLGVSQFYLSGGAVINADNHLNIISKNHVFLLGEVYAGGGNIEGLQVTVNTIDIQSGGAYCSFICTHFGIRGGTINIYNDITTDVYSLSLLASTINLYGGTIKAFDNGRLTYINIGEFYNEYAPSRFNAYGGHIQATAIEIDMDQFNNYGINLEGETVTVPMAP